VPFDGFLKGAGGIAVAIGLWEVAHVVGILPATYVPSIGVILGAAMAGIAGGELPAAVAGTLTEWAVGLLIAGIAGTAMGFLLGLSRWADAAARVVTEFVRPIPSVALIPVAILVFGLDLKMKVALIVFACFWPMLFNARYGIGHLDPLLLDTGRVFGARGLDLVRRVVIPAAFPSVLTGLRVACSIALVLAITSEMVAGGGLGGYIVTAGLAGRYAVTYGGILIGGILGFTLNWAMQRVEHRLIGWSVAYAESKQ